MKNLENFMVGSVKADDLIKDNQIVSNVAARYLGIWLLKKDDSDYAEKLQKYRKKSLQSRIILRHFSQWMFWIRMR